MPTFLFHSPGIIVKIIGMDYSTHGRPCYDYHICRSLANKMLLFAFKAANSFFMINISPSLLPTIFWMLPKKRANNIQ